MLTDSDEDGERWALFDRDEHVGIQEAFSAAKRAGVQVAFSHPSFDLWLLLHFTTFAGMQNGSSALVHEKLRQYEGFEEFDFRNNKSLKGKRIDALRGKERTAAKNAKKLTDDCPTPACSAKSDHAAHCDPLKRDPSTDMWRLLKALQIIP